jgi:hypothetical protein
LSERVVAASFSRVWWSRCAARVMSASLVRAASLSFVRSARACSSAARAACSSFACRFCCVAFATARCCCSAAACVDCLLGACCLGTVVRPWIPVEEQPATTTAAINALRRTLLLFTPNSLRARPVSGENAQLVRAILPLTIADWCPFPERIGHRRLPVTHRLPTGPMGVTRCSRWEPQFR